LQALKKALSGEKAEMTAQLEARHASDARVKSKQSLHLALLQKTVHSISQDWTCAKEQIVKDMVRLNSQALASASDLPFGTGGVWRFASGKKCSIPFPHLNLCFVRRRI
jgi:hypothetical protein